MPIPVNAPPESLAGDLTMSLWRERATLRFLARRKAWEPSIDDCRGLAGRLVEYLKGRGVLRVIRQGAGEQHSIGPIAPMRAAPPMREAVPVPAVRGWAVCRMHGAGGGAPMGNQNALKHGRYTAKAIAERRWLRELLQDCQELLERF